MAVMVVGLQLIMRAAWLLVHASPCFSTMAACRSTTRDANSSASCSAGSVMVALMVLSFMALPPLCYLMQHAYAVCLAAVLFSVRSSRLYNGL